MTQENKAASLRLELAKLGEIQPKRLDGVIVPSSQKRLDSWANEATGFGVQHATNNSQYFRVAKKIEAELSALYESDWATRKGVDMPSEDMVRKGISFLHNDDDENSLKTVEKLEDILINDFNWVPLETEAIKFQRLSGGCATFFNFGGTEEDQRDPIDESQIREVISIRNFPAWLAVPLSWYTDFSHPKLGQPEHYQLLFRDPSTSRTVVVHETRLHIMQGEIVTPNTRAFNRGWGDSPIQSIYNALRDFGVATSAVSGVLQDFNWFSLGIAGLADKVMHQDDDSILERIYLARQKLHSGNLSLYDAESEAMQRHGTPVSGLDGLWDRLAEVQSAAWDIPHGMFMTAKEGKLGGTTAETDKARYYDKISSKQEITSRPWKNKVIHFVGLANGIDDSGIKYKFKPIKTKTDKEKYEEEKIVMETRVLAIQNDVLTPDEVSTSMYSKAEKDLDTVNLNKEERDAQRKLEDFNQENEDAIKQLEIESKTIENNNNKDEDPSEKKEEKKDAQPINIDVHVDAPIIPDIKIPDPIDNTELIKSINARLDQIEARKEDITVKFE